jgi:hypothetical protein
MWAAIAGLAISAISTGIGAAQQKKAARRAQEVEDRRARQQEAINERALERSSQDYFSTSSGKHMLNTLNEDYSAKLRGLQGRQTKAGSTIESALASAENLQKGKANILSSVAAGQDYRRERAEEKYDAAASTEADKHSNALQDYYNTSAQSAANAWGNVGTSAMQAGMGIDGYLSKTGGYKSNKNKVLSTEEGLKKFQGSSDYLGDYGITG